MAAPLTTAQRVELLANAYAREFAGKDRRTRDVARIAALVREARALATMFERKVGALRPDERALATRVTQLAALLSREEQAIKTEQGQGEPTPEEIAISEPAGRAHVYATFLREGFGEHAEHVDHALLLEVLGGFEGCERDAMERLPERPAAWMLQNLNLVRTNLAVCRQQEEEVARECSSGAQGDRREVLLHLSRQQRAAIVAEGPILDSSVVRPARLQALVTALRLCAARLRALDPLTGEDADEIALLESEAERIDAQLRRLLRARADSGSEALAKALEQELATIAALYKRDFAGKSRKAVDIGLLRRIWKRAGSVAVQAADLWNRERTKRHEDLRRLSRQRHGSYDSELVIARDWKAGRYG